MAAPSKRFFATVGNAPERFGITLVRLAVGGVFVMHGYQKWFDFKPAGTVSMFHSMGFPPSAAYAAMTAELLCGCLLVLGFLTRIAAIPILVVMGVAMLEVHWPHGFYAMNMGYEYPLTLGVCALALVFAGPGLLAVDNLLA